MGYFYFTHCLRVCFDYCPSKLRHMESSLLTWPKWNYFRGECYSKKDLDAVSWRSNLMWAPVWSLLLNRLMNNWCLIRWKWNLYQNGFDWHGSQILPFLLLKRCESYLFSLSLNNLENKFLSNKTSLGSGKNAVKMHLQNF